MWHHNETETGGPVFGVRGVVLVCQWVGVWCLVRCLRGKCQVLYCSRRCAFWCEIMCLPLLGAGAQNLFNIAQQLRCAVDELSVCALEHFGCGVWGGLGSLICVDVCPFNEHVLLKRENHCFSLNMRDRR